MLVIVWWFCFIFTAGFTYTLLAVNLLEMTTSMAANGADEMTYIPSLILLAYHACDETQREQYDKLPVMSVDLQECCKLTLNIIKLNSDIELFQPRGKLRSVFTKVRPITLQPPYIQLYFHKNICSIAAFHGHINCLRLAHAMGVPWNYMSDYCRSACDQAVISGSLECLKFAHENLCRWSWYTFCLAARKGHMDCLKYLHENGCPWDSFVCTEAARNGHLECLIYLRQNGCEWDDDTSLAAARSGHLSCLKYCLENGCPLNQNTCNVAAKFGHLDCLRYAFENGCDWDIDEFLNSSFSPVCVSYALEIRSKQERQRARTSWRT